jgi:exodeoxyribonuclease-3
MPTVQISGWNVNGLGSVLAKNHLYEFLETEQPDILCLAETKLSAFENTRAQAAFDAQLNIHPTFKPYAYRHHSIVDGNDRDDEDDGDDENQKGCGGTAIWSKYPPLHMYSALQALDNKGRVTVAEFQSFFVVCVYTPHSKLKLERLVERCSKWDPAFRVFIRELEGRKPVVVVGDFNCVHKYEDVYTSHIFNNQTAGATDHERWSFETLLQDTTLVDSFRYKHPTTRNAYTFWSAHGNARALNNGWRLDYILVSGQLCHTIEHALIHSKYAGSDHCPISVYLQQQHT